MAKSKAEETTTKKAAAKAVPAGKTAARKAGFDFSGVDETVRKAGARALADTLSELTKLEISSGTVELGTGAIPFASEEMLAVPVTASCGGAEASGVIVMTRSVGAALVNAMTGEGVTAPLEAFDDLHRSVLAEAVAGVATALQEGLGMDLALESEAVVEEDMARIEDPVALFACVSVSAEEAFEGQVAIVMPQAAIVDVVSRLGEGAAVGLPSTHFPQLRPDPKTAPAQNLGILLDVPMQMVAVLGRRGVKLRDLLQMGPGSIMELDKLAGEPLELLVNGKLIGYGEVIVLDEKFGIKVRDVVNPEDRLRSANL
ncbi:MAG: flagellar motor switch protein FliN [Armatimonadetes bacterium]|nr:flagellar motor switch protein FliN [Armatimonadota bacterium]